MCATRKVRRVNADDPILDDVPRVIVASEYLRDLVRQLDQAKQRVAIVVLLISDDRETVHLFNALARALNRGVKIDIVLDGYYMQVYFIGRVQRVRRTMESLDRLRSLGATVRVLERSSLNPFKGRCHSKFAVVDDSVYGFGGVNISDKAVHNIDYMLGWANRKLADRLYDLCRTIESDGVHPDEYFVVDEHTTLLVDGGNPGKSIIYQQACELVKRSERVHYVSQFCPTGPLARLLFATETNYYFNRSRQAGMHIGVMLTIDKILGRARTSYRNPQYLHAKFLLAELRDGSHAVISGSHNFKQQGVKYGTMETALYSTDPRLWNQLGSYLVTDVMP